MLGQNIELCDLMFEDESHLYLIHVKKGFNAKMRDLSNQIIISAARLWNDVKSGRYEFVDAVLEAYNNSRAGRDVIPLQDFRNRFNKEIIYVMAFNSDLVGHRRIIDNLENIRSNIAKFCLVQGVKEMQSAHYPLKIFEIGNI
jgi:hypothetical protein